MRPGGPVTGVKARIAVRPASAAMQAKEASESFCAETLLRQTRDRPTPTDANPPMPWQAVAG